MILDSYKCPKNKFGTNLLSLHVEILTLGFVYEYLSKVVCKCVSPTRLKSPTRLSERLPDAAHLPLVTATKLPNSAERDGSKNAYYMMKEKVEVEVISA